MFDFAQIKESKKKAAKLDDQRNEKYELAFNEALEHLKKFKTCQNFEIEILKKSTEKLISSLEQKRSKAEPYICLSCIFYMIDEDRKAIKYYSIANSINPKHPKVQELRNLLGNNANVPVPRLPG
jgi:hypothetical protein